jgi:copper chaperone CopZ
MKRVQLQITGMHCGHCLQSVREALAAVPGVTIERVEIGSATIAVDDSVSGVGALVDAVYDAGYEAEEVPA